ncbi:MAG: methyltransferase domain-containing protein [Gammaproteobacteria bacterium]
MNNPTQIGLPERVAAMRGFERAGATFDNADVVHSEARRRLLERLQLVRLEPACIVDLGSATGKGGAELAAAFPEARVVAIDRSLAMVKRTQARCASFALATAVAGDAERLPLADTSADLIFANLLLPWCAPDIVFGEAARVLREGGLLTFTTVGPGTLGEVRRAWAAIDDAIHVHGFIDMHDIGDLAVRAGLTEPVMDVDTLEVTYRDTASLAADLRACGAANVAAGRRTTLTGRKRWSAFRDALEATRSDGRYAVTVELIFGQAWGGGAGALNERGEAVISLEEMARQLRRS